MPGDKGHQRSKNQVFGDYKNKQIKKKQVNGKIQKAFTEVTLRLNGLFIFLMFIKM